ncbi:MAG TPA: LamG domain-containing protein [Thermoanaerobaculia bacterium]|jgi:hypothetical protein|nr:LamG domain-containing protein [Thermoanaerobaculia bacterium]
MTPITDGLVLYCKLDRIENNILRDLSGQGHDCTAQGDPQTATDATCGHCLALDGQNDWVTLPPASIPAGPQLTVSLWLNGGSQLPVSATLLEALDANGLRVVNLQVPWQDENVYFDCGNAGPAYDRIAKKAQPTEYKGEWVHWAFVKDATAGEMYVYRNGAQWNKGTALTRPVTAVASVRLGAKNDGSQPYPGKVAYLRIYNRALSAGDVGRVMVEDQNALAAFRFTNPLDFNLHNDAGETVLYIDSRDSNTLVGNRTMSLEITNTSGRRIDIQSTSVAVSTENYHFALRFRPGTVSIGSDFPEGWSGKTDTPGDGTAVLYLLRSQSLSLQPSSATEIPLPSLTAIGLGGARGTRVEVRYQGLAYPDDSTPLQGRRILHLSVLNHSGLQVIPLRLSFVGGINQIKNDGTTKNQLTLSIATTLKDGSIALMPKTSDAPSRFILSFDVDLGPALSISVVPSLTWQIEPPTTQGLSRQWIVTTTQTQLPMPGISSSAVILTLTNIVTSAAAGPINLYVRYQNFPGYWDGELVATIQSSPLLFAGSDILWGANSALKSSYGGSLILGGSLSATWTPQFPSAPYIAFRSNVNPSAVYLSNDAAGRLRLKGQSQVPGQTDPNLLVWGNYSALRSDGNIELGGDDTTPGTGMPYIDFHYKDKTEDYNVRITNDGDHQLTVQCLSSSSVNLIVKGNISVKGNTSSINGSFTGDISAASLDITTGDIRVDSGNVIWGNNSSLRNNQGGSLELGGNDSTPGTGTPYIDFHYRGKTEDYNARIINDADHQLSVVGNLRVTGITLLNGIVVISGPMQGAAGSPLQVNGALSVIGFFTATLKNFRIPHPAKPDHDLVHACLEGPEAAVYYRGVARLVAGQATIRLPDYFEALTREEGRTVQLTAKGREPFLLSYEDVVDGAFRVHGTRPDGEFAWEVKAVRADVEELAVEVRR